MKTTQLGILIAHRPDPFEVRAVRREDTPEGLWIHKAHNNQREWMISHKTGYLLLSGFTRQFDALNCAARLKGPDWENVEFVPGSQRPFVLNPKRYIKAMRLAVMKFPRTTPKGGGTRWRVAI